MSNKKLIGTNPNQVPSNADLGSAAFMDEKTFLRSSGSEILAINTVINSTAVDVCVYDTSLDPDGGAWRKRTQNTSWYNEPLNTLYRGSRKEFPAVALIVATETDLTIYDADDPHLPMWMKFDRGTDTNPTMWWDGNNGNVATSVIMKNGLLWITTSNAGSYAAEFISEKWIYFYNNATNSGYRENAGGIAARNEKQSNRTVLTVDQFSAASISTSHSKADIFVPNDSPIDPATGLPYPSVVVSQKSTSNNGGFQVIDFETRTVYTRGQVSDGAAYALFTDEGYIVATPDTADNYVCIFTDPYSSANNTYLGNIGNAVFYPYVRYADDTRYNYPRPTSDVLSTGITLPKSSLAFGVENGGFNILQYTNGSDTDNDGMVALISKRYNSGWIPKDHIIATMADTQGGVDHTKNLIVNGDFGTGDLTGWTFAGDGSEYSYSGGMLSDGGTQGQAFFSTNFRVAVGETYLATFEASGSGGTPTVKVETTGGVALNKPNGNDVASVVVNNAVGTKYYTIPFTPKAGQTTVRITGSGQAWTGTYDNFTCRLAVRNHATDSEAFEIRGRLEKTEAVKESDVVAYSGFSQNNFLKNSGNHNSGIRNVGTEDFYVMAWIRPSTLDSGVGNYFHVFQLGKVNESGQNSTNGFTLKVTAYSGASSVGYVPYFYSGGSLAAGGTYNAANTLGLNRWSHLVGIRRSGTMMIFIDGRLVQTGTSGAWSSLDITDYDCRIGHSGPQLNEFGGDAKLALLKYGAGNISNEQIEKIYNDEKMLFLENAKATLNGTSDTVTAFGYDRDTNLLHVGTSYGRSSFQGLSRVDHTETPVGVAISASNGLVAEE